MMMKDWDEDLVEEMKTKMNQTYDEIINHGFGEVRVVISRESQKILIYATKTYLGKPNMLERSKKELKEAED